MNVTMQAGNGSSEGAEYRSCDVCRLLYHDTTIKPSRYCPLCKAWLCDHCRSHWTRRAIAAILSAGELMRGRAHGDDADAT